jgi:signal peptidase I
MLAMLSGVFLVEMLSVVTESVDFEFMEGGLLLLTFWPTLAVNVKRWHDRDRSAWWFVLTFLGGIGVLVGLWILVECAFFSGSTESNRFGSSPVADHSPVGEVDRFQPGLIVVLIGLTVIGICFTAYRIPAVSMMPALLVGDFIIVDRTAYGIPMPFTDRQVIALNSPSRGDVVIFRYPKDPSVIYIKRVVGIPGDQIGYYDKILYINGEPALHMPVGIYAGKGSGASMSGSSERIEMLDNKQHKILVMSETPGLEGDYIVQEDEYFVLGDNRDNSNDSRFWGTVPEENLVGKASRIWMNWDGADGGAGIDWGRLGMKVQ